MKIRANGIDIEIEDSANGKPASASQPVVLLIMGLGMQLVAWPPQMVQALVDAGFRVIRMDNRDIGLSQHFDHLGKPSLLWATLKFKLGLGTKPPYTLTDMAQDAIGVLDTLKIKYAHVVGVSMGGMIAQRVAIAAPKRVLSLTSIMSSSGARGLPQARPEVLRAMLKRPARNPAAAMDHFVALFKIIGSPAYPVPETEMRERIAIGVKRSFHPVGTLRQMLAIVADTGRAEALASITSRTLVIHGKADPLVPLGNGEDTARRIPGARLLTIDGMGHDLPPEPVRQIVEALTSHLLGTRP
ncbi:MAG: alpha/beta hydrolase [Burkholderiales bacterium PBB3]|nr:MAG: alpha/beta hydrolase [Burkholderiales bacterium PBB3]